MLEDRPVAVPSNRGTGIVTDHQRLDEVFGLKPSELRSALPHGMEPVRHGIGGLEPTVLEVVTPPKAAGKTLAGPLLELKRGKLRPIDPGNELALFVGGDHIAFRRQSRQDCFVEHVSDHCQNAKAV